jgi:hypothetical protein
MKRTWQLTLIASLLPQFIFAQSAVVVKEIRAGIFGGEPRFVVAMNNIWKLNLQQNTIAKQLSPFYNLSIEKLPKGVYYISLQGQQRKEIQQIMID